MIKDKRYIWRLLFGILVLCLTYGFYYVPQIISSFNSLFVIDEFLNLGSLYNIDIIFPATLFILSGILFFIYKDSKILLCINLIQSIFWIIINNFLFDSNLVIVILYVVVINLLFIISHCFCYIIKR